MGGSATENDQQPQDKPVRSRSARIVPIVVVAVMVVLAVVFVSRPSPGTRTTTESSVRVIVGTADGAAQSAYPVALQEGGDPEHEADHIIDPLKGVEGIADATLDWSSDLVLIVRFDPESITAQDIANVLAQTGYLAEPPQQ